MGTLSEKLLFSIDEVRDLTGIGRTNLYREIKENRLKARKRGTKTVVARTDLISWIEALPSFTSAQIAPHDRKV